jgi:two-component system response regulator AtoC
MSHAVLIIEDEEVLARKEAKYLSMEGFEVRVAHSAEQGLAELEGFKPDAVVLDYNLPGTLDGLECLRRIRTDNPGVRVIMVTGQGNERVAVDAMKAGAYDYLSKPVVLSELTVLIQRAMEQDRSDSQLAHYHDQAAAQSGLGRIIGESAALTALKARLGRIIEAVDRIEDGGAPAVLVTGETGSGKELVARALHFGSARSARPFVELNVAAIPAQLVESELFGYERGAFTDARARKLGMVEAANGGTLFLDEIGELDLASQAKLLKLLEDRSVRRLGSVRDHTVDIRVITATNRSLPQMVAEGRFRSDLMYRLNTLTVEVPPLRERGTDIVLLAGHFLTELASRYGKPELRLGTAAARRLQSHDWPGNVRELRNVMEQAVLHCTGRELPPDLLGIPASGSRPDAAAETTGTPVDPPAPDASLADIERNTIEKALLQTGGNISAASRRLGISRDQLRYRIAKYGLDPRA